jgi:transposase-like protein
VACRCATSSRRASRPGWGTAQRICAELRERFEQFKRRDLYDIQLEALFLDAVFLSVRPNGPEEGVLVAWGFTEAGERVLLS